MYRFSAQVEIDREPLVVGRFLLDPERWPEWTDMRDVQVLTEGPVGRGMRARATLGSGLLKSEATWELTAAEPERLVRFETISMGRFSIDGTYRLEPLGGERTRVTFDGTLHSRGALRLLEPLMRGEVRAEETRELERMKGILEAQPGGSGAPVRAAE